MKIIAGLLKGMKLSSPKGDITRPTTARVRESVMGMLAADLPEASFIDLFSGTGAIGIEALSRGVKHGSFVEENPQMIRLLKNHLAEAERRLALQLPEEDRPEVRLYPVSVDALSKRKNLSSYDIIWADPPYPMSKDWLNHAGEFLARISNPGAYFIFETSTQSGITAEILQHGFEFEKLREHGDVSIFIWKRSA